MKMQSDREKPPLTRDSLTTAVLLILTALGVIACIVIVAPFLPAITWALAIAVVAYPLHGWIASRVRRPALAAGLAVALLTAGLLLPVIFIGQEVGQQASAGFKQAQHFVES